MEQPRPPAQQLQKLFFDATRDSATGKIYLKLVNSLGTVQNVKVEITGLNAVSRKGVATVLKADNLDDTNSINDPCKITPKTLPVTGLGTNFTSTLPPYSITILELSAK